MLTDFLLVAPNSWLTQLILVFPLTSAGVTPRRTSKERTYEGRVQVASCYKEVTSFTYAVRSHWGEAIGAPPGIHLNNSKHQGRTHGGKSLTEGPLPLRPKFAEGGGGFCRTPPLLVIIIAIII